MGYYEIVIENHIDQKRKKDFEGLDYKHLANGRTLFYGTLKDQSELFSVLNKIRDMNLTLISIKKDQTELDKNNLNNKGDLSC